ncbi:hypothetical protein O6H91_14G078000 [Diphasiastrum complanatum]|uniref:Uncharacterized protein n=1 Tax=Diphasiastrum complanatum TaxID=34168 RepID=A0ACC2BR59_DIPCM|nr:hypothetical protein O6H91_14G078000 [Diphasiastrum complanatum]
MCTRPEDIYHVTIMPCYDKKLEASRDDFVFAIERTGDKEQGSVGPQLTEVDSVLTSGEIVDLLQAKKIDFRALAEVPLDRMLTNIDEEDHLYGVPGGSGGYAECIFRHAAWTLFGKEFSGSLEFKILRNADFREMTLELDGKTMLRFACAYGFRNIQNLVRKIKAGKCEYHFVEIMACPAGCLNGGGQIKPKKGQSVKDLIQTLESLYLKEMQVRDPYNNPIAKGLYEKWLEKPGSEKALDILHTRYHHREKSVSSQYTNW